MNYKYRLDSSSRKYQCPRCGKKSFVVYLDESGKMLDSSVGRCDRKDKCNHHFPPREFFKTYDRATFQEVRPIRAANEKPDYINGQVAMKSISKCDDNPLAQFLHARFDSLIGEAKVSQILLDYRVGASKMYGGSTVFWQVDDRGQVRTGKVMGYDVTTGKRGKRQNNWVHSIMKETLPNFRMKQCFFGANRLQRITDGLRAENAQRIAMGIEPTEPVVWLFESEKAALIVAMTLAWLGTERAFVPVACGGCDGFNPTEEKKLDPYDGLRLLRDRKVVLFPDEGKLADWQRKATGLRGFAKEAWVATVMEPDHPYTVECAVEPGDALDDLILRYIASNPDIVDTRRVRLAQLLTESYR